LGNGATLGGHVVVGDWARVSAFVGVHQFCRIGEHSIIGGYSVVTRDVLPYSTTSEEREARLYRANTVGLERRGFETARVEQLNKAFRILRDPKLNTAQALEKIRTAVEATPEVADLVRFVETSERGFIK
jgi:UDP-N-acetylglucosamine acyltransferase